MLATLRPAKNSGATPSAPEAFHAPLFHAVVNGLGPTERHVVLDLGAASTPMLAMLGRSRCRVEVADLPHFGGIDLLNKTKPGPALSRATDALLPKQPANDEFDLVLCWDLPNYLTLNALSSMMNAIAQRARSGAIAHALIYYSERDMPERPGRFVPIEEDEKLVDHNATLATIPAPRYSPEDLNMSMGHFVLERARLLSNGMQEILFRL